MPPPATPFRSEVLARLPGLSGMAWRALSGGRTNRLWKVGTAVVKSYDPAAASPLFPNDPQAEARALDRLGPTGLGPRLIGAGPSWVAYAFVEGRSWRSDPAQVARTLFRLHRQDAAGFRPLASGSAALLAQAQAMARDCQGRLPPPPADPCLPPIPVPCLIHGDAVAGNMIAGSAGLTLIDWQCPAAGDPTEDLATFLSPAMQWLYRGEILASEATEAFLSAYPDPRIAERYRRLAPLYRWRMAAHCLWKAERGAPDYAQALALELG